MKHGAILMALTLATFLFGAAALAAPAQAQTGRPLDSGLVLTVDVGSAYRPGEIVEIHFFVTNNGSLAEPTWPGGFPHVHPPNLDEEGLIELDAPVQYGHVGAYRTSLVAPGVPGLYAVHGAATVDGVTVMGFGSFQVVSEGAAGQAMLLSAGALGASILVLVLVVVLLVRQRKGA